MRVIIFRDSRSWKEEEKSLPVSFMPSREAELDEDEWSRYDFDMESCGEISNANLN